jgi:hypothetical protein
MNIKEEAVLATFYWLAPPLADNLGRRKFLNRRAMTSVDQICGRFFTKIRPLQVQLPSIGGTSPYDV